MTSQIPIRQGIAGHTRFHVRVLTLVFGASVALFSYIILLQVFEGKFTGLVWQTESYPTFACTLSLYLLGVYAEVRLFQNCTSQIVARWMLMSIGVMSMLMSLELMFFIVNAIWEGALVDFGILLQAGAAALFLSVGYALGRWSLRPGLDPTLLSDENSP